MSGRKYRRSQTKYVLWIACLMCVGSVAAACQSVPLTFSSNVSCITSNFNGTPIPAGDFIWFNSVFKIQGANNQESVRLAFSNASVSFTSDQGTFDLSVPDSVIVMNSDLSLANVFFDGARWIENTPSAGKLAGSIFLDGIAVQTSQEITNVRSARWCGVFSSSAAGITVNWQWAAAVYRSFSLDNNVLAVKPVDDNRASADQNSDHAGTPESFKDFVVGGARGGGGSNFTGSYSGTASSGAMQNRGTGGGGPS
ncbi:MAG TPA: hypothetical protein VKZ53_16960 [Candidatus Angelobacter sp.]|nr:hypothetical protein [Candidatus Angelobacter sp.]